MNEIELKQAIGLQGVAVNGDRVCRSKACRSLVKKFTECFLDLLAADGSVYCERCGVNLRFHRKRAILRGEDPPLTFEHVDERMKQ